MEYFDIQYGREERVAILALNKFEAIGFYMFNHTNGEEIYFDDFEINTMSPDSKIEVSCIGFPQYKTLEEMYKEKEFGDTPCLITKLNIN